MAPAIMVPAPSAPAIVVTAAAAAHVMAVPMPAPDLDNGVILSDERRNAQSCRSGDGHRERREQREADQSEAFHNGFSHRIIAISGTISRLLICSTRAKIQ